MNDPISNINELEQPNGHTPLPWCCGKSDQGKVRANNEDHFSLDTERNLFIVADGMGGHAAGEVASRIAVEFLHRQITPEFIAMAATFSSLNDEIAEALRQANHAVRNASENHLEWKGMGSTAVLALLHDHALTIANVGDSRAYLLRSGVLQLLSHDHSVAALLAEQNHISHEEIRTHPLRNRLTACLGIEERIEPYTSRILLRPKDRILLCSDGLWDMLTDREIARLWSEHPEPEAAVQALIAAANRAGGQDNITVVALNIGDADDFCIATDSTLEQASLASDDTLVVAC